MEETPSMIEKEIKSSIWRKNAIKPVLIGLLVLFVLHLVFLGKGLEFFFESQLSKIIGAKVEIGNVSWSWKKAEIILRHIAIVNPGDPKQNLVEAENINFIFQRRALLYRCLVIEKTTIHNVQAGTPRRGMHLPILFQTKAQSNNSSIISGFEEAINSINVDALLDTSKLLAEYPFTSLNKLNEANSIIVSQQGALLQVTTALEALSRELSGNIQIGSAQDLVRLEKINQSITKSAASLKDFPKNLDTISTRTKAIQQTALKLKQQELLELKKGVNPPGFKIEKITHAVISDRGQDGFNPAIAFYQRIRNYMRNISPAQAKGKFVLPHSQGETIHFASKKGYQPLWIKKVKLTSSGDPKDNKGYSGLELINWKGAARDISTDPVGINKSFRAKVGGKVMNQPESEVIFGGRIDCRPNRPDTLEFKFNKIDLIPYLKQNEDNVIQVKSAMAKGIGRISFKDNQMGGHFSIVISPVVLSVLEDKRLLGMSGVSINTIISSVNSVIIKARISDQEMQVVSNIDLIIRDILWNRYKSEQNDLSAKLTDKLQSGFQQQHTEVENGLKQLKTDYGQKCVGLIRELQAKQKLIEAKSAAFRRTMTPEAKAELDKEQANVAAQLDQELSRLNGNR